ncbi:hypothetical protein MMC25_008166 [Agyrium rufum]|nr:hypothetical protein [Agyrium rufum]
MRRHQRGGASAIQARGNAGPLPEAAIVMRTYNSELNPSRPLRPSPLTASTIQGMPLDVLDRIRSFPLFLSAPENFLTAIGKHLRPQSHSPNDFILTEGDDAKAMYWLVRGAVAVTSRDGESTFAELKPGAFFGEIGTLMGIPRTANIVARTKCLLLVLKKEDLLKELPNFPEVERTIREEAQERLSILKRKKKETNTSDSSLSIRRGAKRRLEDEEESQDVLMDELGSVRQNGYLGIKRRKSPSPRLIDTASSSALGSGMVYVRQLLKEFPLFSGLPDDLLHFLGLNAQPCTFPPFKDIVQQDSHGREIYFLVRGEVEVIIEKGAEKDEMMSPTSTRLESSQRVEVKARLRQGQYFGEVAGLSLAPRRTATVRTVTSVECLMISGPVLTEFWKRCPPSLKLQVEETAEKRLLSAGDSEVIMPDAAESSLPIEELEITDHIPPLPKTPRLPTVTLSLNKPESPHKPSRFEDRPVLEPFDPDPFLSPDYNNYSRSTKRRSSLAPSPSDDPPSKDGVSSGPRSPLLQPPRSDTASPLKRPRLLSRRPSQYNKGKLSDPILENIFRQLDIVQLMRLRLVSLRWAKILKESPKVLTNLDLAKYNRKVTDSALMNSICPFVGSRPRYIDISNCFHITDHGFAALSATCGSRARAWKMKSVWDITAQAVNEMANMAKELEEVDLSNCRKVSDTLLARVVGWVVEGPSTQINYQAPGGRRRTSSNTASMQPAPIGYVYGCPKLKKLTLSYCKHVTDRSMAHLAAYAHTRLEEVDLTRCTTITDQGFQQWGQKSFTRLTKLCLADCTYLTDNAIIYLANAAKGLKYLDLSFCCALSDTATEVLALGCPHLMSLDLSFCGSAVSDASLRAIGLHLLELRHLSVRGCVRVTGLGVETVVNGCRKLESFDVSQCKNLAPWLDGRGLERVRTGVKFKTVADGLRRS